MCPDLDHKTCKDSMGKSYGVLCDTRFIGNIITTSGKRKRVDQERDLEDAFIKYGTLRSVWVARRPPGFGELRRMALPDSSWSLPVVSHLARRHCH